MAEADKWPFKEIVRCNMATPRLGTSSPAFASSIIAGVTEEQGFQRVKRAGAYRAALRVVWAPPILKV